MIRFLPLTLLALGGCYTGEIEEARDRDGDGFEAPELGGADCDDGNALINPDAPEVCGDGVDNDCDGVADDAGFGNVTWYPDVDGDGYGENAPQQTCVAPDDSVAGLSNGVDCNDTDSAVNPGAVERCGDDIDNDCNDEVDVDAADGATWYEDQDADGYPGAELFSDCTAPQSSFSDLSFGEDCDDTNNTVNPAGQEICGDGLDNDCNGATDDSGLGAVTWYVDSDNDGFPGPTSFSGCTAPSGSYSLLSGGTDCNDLDASIRPDATEIFYDGVDQNCDNASDYDADMDGVNSDAHGGQDCDDTNAAVLPSATEVCNNGLDDDCSVDSPECAWPVGGDLADVEIAEYINFHTGAVPPTLLVHDFNADGVDDLMKLAGTSRYNIVFGPLTIGTFDLFEDFDVEMTGGFNDNNGSFALYASVIVQNGVPSLVIPTLASGTVYGLPIPVPMTGELESSLVELAYSPSRSRFGRSVVAGSGFDGGAGTGQAFLQGALQTTTSFTWLEGIHVWPNGSPPLSGFVRSGPVYLPAGSTTEWEAMALSDVNQDGLDDIVVRGELADGRGVVAVERSPLIDGHAIGGAGRVLTPALQAAPGSGLSLFHMQLLPDGVSQVPRLVVSSGDEARLMGVPLQSTVQAVSSGVALVSSNDGFEVGILPIGDFNRSGHPDVAVVSYGSSTVVDVFYDVVADGIPSGDVQASASFTLPSASSAARLIEARTGDLNDDGFDDLAFAWDGSVFILFGQGQ